MLGQKGGLSQADAKELRSASCKVQQPASFTELKPLDVVQLTCARPIVQAPAQLQGGLMLQHTGQGSRNALCRWQQTFLVQASSPSPPMDCSTQSPEG